MLTKISRCYLYQAACTVALLQQKTLGSNSNNAQYLIDSPMQQPCLTPYTVRRRAGTSLCTAQSHAPCLHQPAEPKGLNEHNIQRFLAIPD